MYKIRLIWVGKTQETYLKKGIEIYLAKLKHYVHIELLEIKPNSATQDDQNLIRLKESQKILSQIQPHETTIVLDEKGQQMPSVNLASWLEELKTNQHDRINFVIGGAFGIDKSLFQQSSLLSFSAMTFTHQMIRLMLVEQVYRAFTIINSEPYHH